MIEPVGDFLFVKYVDENRAQAPFKLQVCASERHQTAFLPGDVVLSLEKPLKLEDDLHVLHKMHIVAKASEEVTGSDRLFHAGSRLCMLPIGRESGDLGSFTMTISPQILFRGEQLVLDPETAPSWSIGGIFVGQRVQLATWGEIPASVFMPSPKEWRELSRFGTLDLDEWREEPPSTPPNAPKFQFDVCEPGISIVFQFNKKPLGHHPFGGGVLIGRVPTSY